MRSSATGIAWSSVESVPVCDMASGPTIWTTPAFRSRLPQCMYGSAPVRFAGSEDANQWGRLLIVVQCTLGKSRIK